MCLRDYVCLCVVECTSCIGPTIQSPCVGGVPRRTQRGGGEVDRVAVVRLQERGGGGSEGCGRVDSGGKRVCRYQLQIAYP